MTCFPPPLSTIKRFPIPTEIVHIAPCRAKLFEILLLETCQDHWKLHILHSMKSTLWANILLTALINPANK